MRLLTTQEVTSLFNFNSQIEPEPLAVKKNCLQDRIMYGSRMLRSEYLHDNPLGFGTILFMHIEDMAWQEAVYFTFITGSE